MIVLAFAAAPADPVAAVLPGGAGVRRAIRQAAAGAPPGCLVPLCRARQLSPMLGQSPTAGAKGHGGEGRPAPIV
jgi:hypothetical protein